MTSGPTHIHTRKKRTRRERREAINTLIFTLRLHDFFPVRVTTVSPPREVLGIAQFGGPAYYLGLQGDVAIRSPHAFKEGEQQKWPDLALLRTYAKAAGVAP